MPPNPLPVTRAMTGPRDDMADGRRGNVLHYPGNPRQRPRFTFTMAATSDEMERRRDLLTNRAILVTEEGPLGVASRVEQKSRTSSCGTLDYAEKSTDLNKLRHAFPLSGSTFQPKRDQIAAAQVQHKSMEPQGIIMNSAHCAMESAHQEKSLSSSNVNPIMAESDVMPEHSKEQPSHNRQQGEESNKKTTTKQGNTQELRSSPRLQGKNKTRKPIMVLAQETLAKKWGIVEEDKSFDDHTLQQYLDTYKNPLTDEAMQAIKQLSTVTMESRKKKGKNKNKEDKKKLKKQAASMEQ
ncbi:hypothetical protein PR202_ga00258 [Eleusine coracana subsp. coracana]|uniref:Uncharacterized protein n=1 Tax=Eleusine coracana subsp. coracana TaxID=191504 RepID=A0AAV5BG25_ELECO|nr:hypothetical protein PR202_ga00258 [Eleusine coracana subsp. coracana]